MSRGTADGRKHEEYSNSVRGLNDYGELLKGLMGALLANGEIKPHSISFRVKQRESALKKIESAPEKYLGYESLTDLLGIRIISYFSDDVDKICRVLEREFKVDRENSIDKRRVHAPDTFGYMSVHYILSMSDERCRFAEYSRFSGVYFEVQIRSILQHAWAEIEHDLGYKSANQIPTEFRRTFSRIAGTLEGADEEFTRIRDSLAKYQDTVNESMSKSFVGIEINGATLQAYIRESGRLNRLDELIASTFNQKLVGITAGEALDATANLPLLDITTIDQIEDRLHQLDAKIVKFAARFRDVPEIGRPKPGIVIARGTGLIYLCYYLLGSLDAARRMKMTATFFPALSLNDQSLLSNATGHVYASMNRPSHPIQKS